MLDRDVNVVVNECPLDPSIVKIDDGCLLKMTPSPENDTTPKAPDKTRHDKGSNNNINKEKSKDEKELSDLNDGELKGLLDEALNYKNPKDREGKSKLFNHLLNEAEEDERNARAARAGGSELVRYCNPSAKRNSRHRKKPSSISENMMHGGSLDNLAKEELYETSKQRTKKSVSARQREGGSLPCNVNASIVTNLEYQFIEEVRRKKEMTEKESFTSNDLEAESLLEHDSLAMDYQEQTPSIEIVHYPVSQPAKYTSRATLQVNNVDDPIQVSHLEQSVEKRSAADNSKNVLTKDGSNYVGAPKLSDSNKKVDENGNAVQQNALKSKKKRALDRNVRVLQSENVEGHRSDIIDNVEKLLEFIGDGEEKEKEKKSVKSKVKTHASDDTNKSKKQRAHSSKNKNNRSELKKSNSLSEISTTNLEDFEFSEDKVVIRNNKNNTEKSRERRSWGTMEPLPIETLYNAPAENLETAEFRVVTKKKKTKKLTSSDGGRTKESSAATTKHHPRGSSPDPRHKAACSVPHSEKSNDSSDVDSVKSLPIDSEKIDRGPPKRLDRTINTPASYAEKAKNYEKQKEKVPKEVEKISVSNSSTVVTSDHKTNDPSTNSVKNTPPDVHNIKNFPAIPKPVVVTTPVEKSKNSNKTSKNTNKHSGKSTNKPVVAHQNIIQSVNMGIPYQPQNEVQYSNVLPPDIPDVQTIEKLQRLSQGHPPSNCYNAGPQSNDCGVNCDNERTSADNLPAVIWSAASEAAPDITFGFCINEQLLEEDKKKEKKVTLEEFSEKYIQPPPTIDRPHLQNIVDFISDAWREFSSDPNTEYYSEEPDSPQSQH